MNSVAKNILAVIAGLIVGSVVNMGLTPILIAMVWSSSTRRIDYFLLGEVPLADRQMNCAEFVYSYRESMHIFLI